MLYLSIGSCTFLFLLVLTRVEFQYFNSVCRVFNFPTNIQAKPSFKILFFPFILLTGPPQYYKQETPNRITKIFFFFSK